MCVHRNNQDSALSAGRSRWSIFRFRNDKSGTAAIEFAVLAIPFFLLLFAIIETCIAFAAEQTVNHVVNKMGRELRTGRITFNTGNATDMTEDQFQARFCEDLSIVFSCGDDVDDRLFLDLRSFNQFSDIPKNVKVVNGRIDTTDFDFAPGGASSINVLRAYYLWRVTTDLMRPYLANIVSEGDAVPNHYLIVATTAYRNEAFR